MVNAARTRFCAVYASSAVRSDTIITSLCWCWLDTITVSRDWCWLDQQSRM